MIMNTSRLKLTAMLKAEKLPTPKIVNILKLSISFTFSFPSWSSSWVFHISYLHAYWNNWEGNFEPITKPCNPEIYFYRWDASRLLKRNTVVGSENSVLFAALETTLIFQVEVKLVRHLNESRTSFSSSKNPDRAYSLAVCPRQWTNCSSCFLAGVLKTLGTLATETLLMFPTGKN